MTDPLLEALPPEVIEIFATYANARIAGVQRGFAQRENQHLARIHDLEQQLRSAGLEPIQQEVPNV